MFDDMDSWDYFLSHITKQDELDEVEKQEIRINWSYLRKVLGEDWFKKEENKQNPLMYCFYNSAPWQLRWIGELGLGIETLSKKENFHSIIERICSPTFFEGAYYEFRVGYSLFKLKILFEFLKPLTKKTPDIVVSIDGRKLFLEVTKKTGPDDHLNSYQNYRKISEFLWSKGGLADNFVFYYDILKPLSTPRTNKILQICEDMLEKAKTSGFEEGHLQNIIDLYLVKKENVERVPKEKRVMQAKTPEFNEVTRIKGTINDKAAQLETGHPAVLIIFDANLWIPYATDPLCSNLVDELEEYVIQDTNLSAVVIEIERTCGYEEPFTKEDERYIVVKGCDRELLRSKNKIIILNGFAKYPLLPEEKELLKKM